MTTPKYQKMVTLVGSPRRNGNTADMAHILQTNLTPAYLEQVYVQLSDFEIKPCSDCRGCLKGRLDCTVRDDLQPIYRHLEAADLLVFATPIYWFAPTAQMKAVIDRLRPYYRSKKLQGKSAVLLLPAGSGAGDCDLTITMFTRMFKDLGILYNGCVTAKVYDIGDVEKDPEIKFAISILAEELS